MSNVIVLADYKTEKRLKLYLEPRTGRVSGNPISPSASDFEERIRRIRESLDKINQLMAALRDCNDSSNRLRD